MCGEITKGFEGFTALHFAAECGHVGIAEILLESGQLGEICVDAKGRTPLHIAAGKGVLSL